MYVDSYSTELVKKLKKIKKKDSRQYSIIRNKMDDILASPNHSYKYLHHGVKGVNRVHIGHFVLVFIINHSTKTVSFEDYDHHDNIYQ